MRKFTGFDQQIHGGEFTAEELAAAQACGMINSFRESPIDVRAIRAARLPEGWSLEVDFWGRTYEYDNLMPPEHIPANAILMGFARPIHGEARYPIWLYKTA